MNLKIIFIFGFIVKFSEETIVESYQPSELNVKQLISIYGYPIETHNVVTEDGYVLELHRIPYGLSNLKNDYKPAVLIVSGFLCSSADWVNLGSNRSLGLILADHGYDVWLCSTRGRTWSKKHIKLDPTTDSNAFWNFSFQEIASYDLPATIDYILTTTKQTKLYYIGHSQGTFSYFAMLSEKPNYNNKIRLMIGLAPADTTKYAQFPFEILYSFLEGYYQKSNGDKNLYYQILEHSEFLAKMGQLLCGDKLPLREVCASAYYIVEGYSPVQLNKTLIPVILMNFPAGASNKELRHLIQLRSGFRKYNYGTLKNRKIYGQNIPPSYNLSKVTTPVALYYGDKDALLSYKRGQYLAKRLPNVVTNKFIFNFAHFDFLWGIDSVTLVYNDMLEVMKLY